MKWSLFQLLTLTFIIFIMWFLEYITGNRTIQISSGEWTAVNSSLVPFFIVALLMSCFYLLFLFEAKKEKSIFASKVWTNMPIIFITLGVLSSILFIIGGAMGPVFEWVQQWRFLVYIFLVYFLLLVFLFIFSIEHKKQGLKKPYEKSVHVSYSWTLVIFLVLFVFL